MKRFLFAIFTLITVVATAQPKAVTWSTSIEHTEEFTLLTVHADIEPGWHLYSQNLADGALFLLLLCWIRHPPLLQ